MPKLVRLYIRQSLIGFALSALFVGLLFAFNVANLWHLVSHSPSGWLAGVLLFMFNGIVFSGVQFGIAVMSMGRDDDDDHGRRRPYVAPRMAEALAPIPVRADEPRMRRR
ncbi:hypothetical protein [Rhodovulum adriaticum]|uniref:Uncharacterized protein n=1 Tax=Rhodovulum adriaticum TaxID=35804 RepID=A0A4V2SL94_RHOAD|nr:hypothetical protein [Rhodovulum adriaticum]MBK1636024.1 hypothetical protein [Rhodovulum adriaticum]TCP22456.1 hypothetical protein EV656_10642 [Rhodovulum adriaticum]